VFSLDATSSLTPEIAGGSDTPTFTRESVATGRDVSGNVYDVASGSERYWLDKGVLIEATRENRTTYSEDFDNAAWTPLNAVVTPNATVSPDGTMNACRLADDAGGGSASVYVGKSGVPMHSGEQVVSCFCKADGLAFVRLFMGGIAAGNFHVHFSLIDGSFNITENGGGAVQNAGADDYGNGWWRCWVNFDDPGPNCNPRILVAESLSDATVPRDGNSSIFIWGHTTEQGQRPSSTIRTTSAAVTRATDALSYQSAGNI
jgi:hypothetical protein